MSTIGQAHGILYIVATPIGNLEDITLRALRVLREVGVVFAEDTREGKKLLSHFDIHTQIERYDEHSHDTQKTKIFEYLNDGKDVALITDAGTPGISDPGYRLVRAVKEELSDVDVVPIPGASALTTALSASGLKLDTLTFLGFVPHKKGRKTFFGDIKNTEGTVVFYESPHRILKTLAELKEGITGERIVVVARELTKIHEEFIQGSAQEVYEYYSSHPDKVRGEFVVMID